jgi:predicted aspartyl protease
MRDIQYFDPKNGIPPTPVVNLYLQNPSNHYLSAMFNYAVIDTGADFTSIPLEIITDKLFILPSDSQEKIIFNGVASKKIKVLAFRVRISFDGENYINIKAAGILNEILKDEIIIGRDVLNLYEINLDGRNLLFTIS